MSARQRANKKYYDNNKDVLNTKSKLVYQQNKDKLKRMSIERYHKNKKENKKYCSVCDIDINKYYFESHIQTPKHQDKLIKKTCKMCNEENIKIWASPEHCQNCEIKIISQFKEFKPKTK